MKNIKITTEYITLQQLLKMTDIISSGGYSKIFLADNNNKVLVNDVIESRRGKKLYVNDIIVVNNKIFKIV